MKKVIVFGMSVFLLMGCGTKGADEVTIKIEKPERNGAYFKNGEVKINDIKMKITKTEVIQPGDPGNDDGEKPILVIWYDTTNVQSEHMTPDTAWDVVFTVTQDNDPNVVNKLGKYHETNIPEYENSLKEIKVGGTLESIVAYELNDLETPITLTATQGLMGDKLGEEEIEIK